MIIIERCKTKPGWIRSARTYKLFLNDNGLYIIDLGRATGYKIKDTALNNILVNKIEAKFKKREVIREEEISGMQLDDLIDQKKNFLIKKSDIQRVKLGSNLDSLPKLATPSIKVITLHFQKADEKRVLEIYSKLT